MTKQKIYIADCQIVKTGETDGREWTLYSISDPKGVRYSTFEAKYSAMVGQEVEVTVEERLSTKINPKTNEPYKNLTIIEPRKVEVSKDDILAMINDLRERVEELEKGQGASLVKVVKELKQNGELPPF